MSRVVTNKLLRAIDLWIDRIKSRRELRKALKASYSQCEYAEEPDPVIDDIDYVRRS
jgi:hypothetical protein